MPPAFVQDRCWGVPVVAAISAFLVFLASSSSGVLYVFFMDEFGVNHEMAAWPQSTYVVVSYSIGLVQSVLQQRVPLYHITLFGVALTCAGLVACAFAPDIVWMAVLYGGVYGAGGGISMISLSLYILLYFDKYRGTGTAFKYIGWAASGVVGPTLLAFMAESYDSQGCLLLVGAAVMHAIPLAMLLGDPRPVSVPACCLKVSSNDDAQQQSPNGPHLQTNGELLPPKPLLMSGPTNQYYSTKDDSKKGTSAKDVATARWNTKEHEVIGGVTERAAIKQCEPNHCDSTAATKPRDAWHRHAKMTMVDAPSLLSHYAALFRSPLFYMFLLPFITTDLTTSMLDTTIVEYGIDKGAATLEGSKQLQTFTALGQLVGRIVVPFVSDKVEHSRCPLTAASFAVASACLFLISRFKDYASVAVLMAAVGVCEGYLMCIKGVLIGDYLGPEALAAVSGLMGVAMAPILLSSPAVIGFFRDKLGSYDQFYWMLAAVNLLAASLVCLVVVDDKRRRKA
ncbi:hypothetical protein V5799_008044 [Amblyomma americanum]|uniref:Monocarboxylate transporter n=1 Tax=Amblyomma americanum TaxID=6943 RepID=A0AAQ4FE85_AMBAM